MSMLTILENYISIQEEKTGSIKSNSILISKTRGQGASLENEVQVIQQKPVASALPKNTGARATPQPNSKDW